MRYVTAQEIYQRLSPAKAVEALRHALKEGYDPADDFSRRAYTLDGGQLLTMPSTRKSATGIKVLTVNTENHNHKVPRIQGAYLYFEGGTLTPTAVLDGEALTNLRTPAVSLAGILHLLEGEHPLKVAIIGTGPQGLWHEKTVRDVFADRDLKITFMSRTQPDNLSSWQASDSPEAQQTLQEAELILSCTSSSTPVLTRQQVRQDAVIVAVGSHSPDARELSADLIEQSQVMVEDIETARREAGDLIMAAHENHFTWEDALTLKEALRDQRVLDRSRPVVFKTTGMGWEDLVLAEAIIKN